MNIFSHLCFVIKINKVKQYVQIIVKIRKDSETEVETHEGDAKFLFRGKTEKILIAAFTGLMKRFVQNFNALINLCLYVMISMYSILSSLKCI